VGVWGRRKRGEGKRKPFRFFGWEKNRRSREKKDHY